MVARGLTPLFDTRHMSVAPMFKGAAGNRQALYGLEKRKRSIVLNSIIYLVGLVVVVLFILSFLGLR